MRAVLDGVGLAAAVKASGVMALHVVAPARDLDPGGAAALPRPLAPRSQRLNPDAATKAFLLADRGSRAFLDPVPAAGPRSPASDRRVPAPAHPSA